MYKYIQIYVRADVPRVPLRMSKEMFIMTTATLSMTLYSKGHMDILSVVRNRIGITCNFRGEAFGDDDEHKLIS